MEDDICSGLASARYSVGVSEESVGEAPKSSRLGIKNIQSVFFLSIFWGEGGGCADKLLVKNFLALFYYAASGGGRHSS